MFTYLYALIVFVVMHSGCFYSRNLQMLYVNSMTTLYEQLNLLLILSVVFCMTKICWFVLSFKFYVFIRMVFMVVNFFFVSDACSMFRFSIQNEKSTVMFMVVICVLSPRYCLCGLDV